MATIQGAFLDDDLAAIYGTPSDDIAFGSDGIFDVLSRYDENPDTEDFDSPEAIGASATKSANAFYTYTNGDDTIALVQKTTNKLFTLSDDFDDAALTKVAGAVGLAGNDGDNFLGGNDLANTISGGAGNDSILAGAGIDTINYDLASGDSDSIIGGTGQDIVNLSGADLINLTFTSAEVGNGSVVDGDSLANQDGGLAVRIEADGTEGRSDDEGVTFVAAEGTTFSVNDLVSGANRGDDFTRVVLGTSANDSFAFAATADYVNGGAGNDNIVTNAGNDFLVGGTGNDTLNGGLGNDSFIGGSGNDVIVGGAGDDIVTGATSTDGDDVINIGVSSLAAGQTDNDSVNAGGGNNTITTGLGNDTIESGDGNDTIITGAGDKLIDAGNGNNKVTTNAGDDEIETGSGRDTINSGAGDDLIDSGSNHDSILAGDGNDEVFAGSGRDTIDGGNGDDLLVGDAGNDTIKGGNGDDVIAGGTGNDLLTGGAGDDLFVILEDDLGIDVITDFKTTTVGRGSSAVTTSDELFILGHDGGDDDFSFDDFEASSFPDPSIKGVFISFNDGGSVLLKNVNLGDLFFDDANDTFSILKGEGNVLDASDDSEIL